MKYANRSGSKGKKGLNVKSNHDASSANGRGFRCRDERLEQLQADHEHFLQAFEKPTQIYRYLRTRTLISPIFLNRNLTFMKQRIHPRSNSARLQGFRVDSLLEKKLKANQDKLDLQAVKPFMTLTFLGFYDKKRERPLDRVNIELLLVKSGSKKGGSRDNGLDPDVVHVPLGTCDVPVNPSEEHPPSKAPALSIPYESFAVSNGLQVATYSLLVRVFPSALSCQPQFVNGTESSVSAADLHSNGDASSTSSNSQQGDENEEPASKRRKLQRAGQSLNDDLFKFVSRELCIYDKFSRCLLTEGEYELFERNGGVCHQDESTDGSPRKGSVWENAVSQQTMEAFLISPSLKFRLSWSNEPAGALVERPRPLMPRDNVPDFSALRKDRTTTTTTTTNGGGRSLDRNGNSNGLAVVNGSCVNSFNSSSGGDNGKSHHGKSSCEKANSVAKQLRILYQFLYNNNSRQQTEAKDDLRCPWCCLNCLDLYALLKHLKLSHPRFLFTYLPTQEGARIDVSVSELFDSTYVGNPNDMISQPPGIAFSRHGPVQRTPITHILVCKPKRTPPSLSEFLEIEENDLNGPYDGQRPFVTGHNRLYNYSTTNLPMPPCAISQPSTEDHVDPPWLMTKICRMIDEFSDVNEGEKELMKMWNLHVQHYTFVGDRQLDLALKMFVEERGGELLEKKLYRNFVLHLCNMYEFGVLGPGHVFTAITRLQQFIIDNNLQSHLNYWTESAQLRQQGEEEPPVPVSSTSSPQRKDFSGLFKSDAKTAGSSPSAEGGEKDDDDDDDDQDLGRKHRRSSTEPSKGNDGGVAKASASLHKTEPPPLPPPHASLCLKVVLEKSDKIAAVTNPVNDTANDHDKNSKQGKSERASTGCVGKGDDVAAAAAATTLTKPKGSSIKESSSNACSS